MPTGSRGHFEIRKERTDAKDHYMCAEYLWTVVDTRNGKVVARFREVFEGSMSGTEDVAFSKDGLQLVVKDHDGTVRRQGLPG